MVMGEEIAVDSPLADGINFATWHWQSPLPKSWRSLGSK